jgi:hypothetical protein
VANRFADKSCVLCPSPSVGVGEHVWPTWLIGDLHGGGPFHTEMAGTPYTKRDNTTVATFDALPSVHVPMCTDCNGRLNTLVEEPARPVVRRVLPWSSTHAWPTLTADDAAALGRWFLKVGLLLSHPDAVDDAPHVARDTAAARFDDFREDWVAWMAAGADPPEDFSVYLTRRSAVGERPWNADGVVLSLPGRVEVAGSEQRFMTRSVGIGGVDATIVWHPGTPLQHPLVQSGRAGVLWPNPAAIDLSRLPVVQPSAQVCRRSSAPGRARVHGPASVGIRVVVATVESPASLS